MSGLSSIQLYCLNKIGITRWVSQTSKVLGAYDKPYQIYYEDSSNDGEVLPVLLSKIINALNWTPEIFQSNSFLPQQEPQLNPFGEKVKCVLWFGWNNAAVLQFGQTGRIQKIMQNQTALLILPSLEEIKSHPELKKQIWNVLKPFKI